MSGREREEPFRVGQEPSLRVSPAPAVQPPEVVQTPCSALAGRLVTKTATKAYASTPL